MSAHLFSNTEALQFQIGKNSSQPHKNIFNCSFLT